MMRRKIAVFLLIAGVGLAGLYQVLSYETASAAIVGKGFFSKRGGSLSPHRACDGAYQRWHKVWCGGIENYANNKSGFIKAVENKLKHGSDQEKLGAAFIIYTMLGYDSAPRGRTTVSNSNIAEWKARINNPDIKIIYEGSPGSVRPNSAYVKIGNTYDMMFIDAPTDDAVLTFKHKDKKVYRIKLRCANPVGDLGGLPKVTNWSIGGSTTVNKSQASPGESVKWDHKLTNNGSSSTNSKVSYTIEQKVGGNVTTVASGTIDTNWSAGSGNSKLYTQTFLIGPEHLGERICQYIKWSPRSSSNSSSQKTSERCVDIPLEYDLKPSIDVGTKNLEEGETQVKNIDSSVENSGPTKSKNAYYGVIRFVVRKDGKPGLVGGEGVNINNFMNANAPCDVSNAIRGSYGGPGAIGDCSVLEHGQGEMPKNISKLMVDGQDSIDSLNLEAGDSVCYTTMISAYNQNVSDSVFRYATPYCLPVSKRPKVHFWGADVRSGSQVVTSQSEIASKTYGAWAEYGILSSDHVISSSGGRLAGGVDGAASSSDYNKLTFANKNGQYGQFDSSFSLVLPSFSDKAVNLPEGEEINVGDLAPGRYTSDRTNLAIGGTILGSGKRLVIEAPRGTVILKGDVVYESSASGGYTGYMELPQLVIRAKNIIVASDVVRVDAWLIASEGYVSTCGAVGGSDDWLTDLGGCGKQLRINGPIVSDKVYLRRTFGAGASSRAEPAEIINLRPDVYMWSYGESLRGGNIKTMHLRELPPRL